MKEKIALGTVQFGLSYGVNNHTGMVPVEEVERILKICKSNEINVLDTAHAYGKSESVLGDVGVSNFKIVSKLPSTRKNEVKEYFNQSIKHLNVDSLYAYMLHNFSIYQSDKTVWGELCELKKEGRVKKIGVSLYSPDELKLLFMDNIDLDIIQIPYNVFDRRFEEHFDEIKSRGIEIHSRSTFLQGLFFKEIEKLPDWFSKVKNKLIDLNELVNSLGIEKSAICLGYVLQNQFIDHVVIGVDNHKQLQQNIKLSSIEKGSVDWKIFDVFMEEDLNIINPANWRI